MTAQNDKRDLPLRKILKGLAYALVFIFALWLQIYGRSLSGKHGLLLQLLSLALFLGELWLYNRRYRD